jgi:hypothetical protein
MSGRTAMLTPELPVSAYRPGNFRSQVPAQSVGINGGLIGVLDHRGIGQRHRLLQGHVLLV